MRNLSYNLIFSYVLIALGVYLLAAAGYDEYRGATTRPVTFHRRGMTHASYENHILVRRMQNPDLYHQFMTFHWIWAVGFEAAGWLLYIRSKS